VQDRIRKEHWGARTLDLDLLLFGHKIMNHPRLTLPHKGLYQRSFVLFPLFDIAPDLLLPNKQTIYELCKNISIQNSRIKRLNERTL
jgi:2-amino-4-hydroxy-6-hydroxymethyldihydropteridine diphosphokinase